MEGARDRLDKLVHDLKDVCLLLDGVESDQFAMHDVIRDVAITFAHEEHHVFTTRNDVERDWKDRDKLKKCTMISLPSENTIISQLWPNDLDCPNLEYFNMTYIWNFSFKIPEGFFTVMPKLRVLNLVRLQQTSLPSSIHHLKNLQTLCLDKSNIEGVPIIGKLNKLKVLSLRNSYIKEFPTEMGQLTQLRLLDLSNCRNLKVIAPNVISKLSNLEELYLKECPIQWKIEVLEELKLLSNLASVELDIEDNKVIFPDLKVLVLMNIISRKIWDCQLPSSSFENLKELTLRRCTKIKFVFPYTITKNLQQLQYLEIKDCIDLEEIVAIEEITEAAASVVFPEVTFLELENLPELATFYPRIHTLEWPKLKRLEMKSCDKFKIFNSEPNSLCLDHKVIFPNLKVLELKSSLGEIWNKESSTYSYENLTHLTLFECDKIKYVFPLSIAKSLQQLQHLKLTSCKVLEGIVAPEEGTKAVVNFSFPQVTKVNLLFLPEFTDFYPGIHTLEWPKLKELMVRDCPKFKMISSEPNVPCFDQKINHD
ncbi:probable disease resistance protein At4g27220 [Mangifera indica]|uniref:probable disease resistance protein At4g27220 n=1 Tax=Mangifera indica TaxID=29780 RepID=UPI001CFA3A29|nr:probable disease resistance protein At4g27220 [Mangifera indica]